MKILIIGAGVLGSRYAVALQEAGHSITILARGHRLQDIRSHGIVLQSLNSTKFQQAEVDTIETLGAQEKFDLALVLIRGNQVEALLPVLKRNKNIPSIVFLGNRIDSPQPLIDALGEERIFTGFAGAAGIREGYIVKYLDSLQRIQGVTYVGCVSGKRTKRLMKIQKAFEKTVFPLRIVKNMEAWHKHHLALVIPLALGIYASGGDIRKLAEKDDILTLIVRAIREGFGVFRKLGYPLTPSKFWLYALVPEKLLVAKLRKLFCTQGAEIGLAGHANTARDEMAFFADCIKQMLDKHAIPAPAYRELYQYRPN